MVKQKCDCCNKTNALKIRCKFCSKMFCTFCLIPEEHKCEKIRECIREAKDKLTQELLSYKCVKSKI